MFAALGWLAVGLYVCAQCYLSFSKDFRRPVFYWLNLIGALALAIASMAIASWQAVAVNAFWVSVSVFALRARPWPQELSIGPRFVYWLVATLVCASLIALTATVYLSVSLLGWAGTLLFCGIYFLFATGRLPRRGYLLLNVLAAFLLMPVYYFDGNMPSLALNVFWAAISLGGAFSTPSSSNNPPQLP